MTLTPFTEDYINMKHKDLFQITNLMHNSFIL